MIKFEQVFRLGLAGGHAPSSVVEEGSFAALLAAMAPRSSSPARASASTSRDVAHRCGPRSRPRRQAWARHGGACRALWRSGFHQVPGGIEEGDELGKEGRSTGRATHRPAPGPRVGPAHFEITLEAHFREDGGEVISPVAHDRRFAGSWGSLPAMKARAFTSAVHELAVADHRTWERRGRSRHSARSP